MDENEGKAKEGDVREPTAPAASKSLPVTEVRWDGNLMMLTFKRPEAYDESQPMAESEAMSNLREATARAIASYIKNTEALIETEGPQKKERLLMVSPDGYEIPLEVKSQILDERVSRSALLFTDKGEYVIRDPLFYPLLPETRAYLEGKVPHDIAMSAESKLGVAGGRIKSLSVPADPQNLYSSVSAGTFRESFGSSGVIDDLAAITNLLSKSQSQENISIIANTIVEFIVNGVLAEFVARAEEAKKSPAATFPVNDSEALAIWRGKANEIIPLLQTDVESQNRLSSKIQATFGEREETRPLLVSLMRWSSARLAFVKEGGFEARALTPAYLNEDLLYIANLTMLIDWLSLSAQSALTSQFTELIPERLKALGADSVAKLGSTESVKEAIKVEEERYRLQRAMETELSRAASIYTAAQQKIEKELSAVNGKSAVVKAALADPLHDALKRTHETIFRPETSIPATNEKSELVSAYAKHMSLLSDLADSTSNAKITINTALSDKEREKVGSYLLADLQKIVKSAVSGTADTAPVRAAIEQISSNMDQYRIVVHLSGAVLANSKAASEQGKSLSANADTDWYEPARVQFAEVSGAMAASTEKAASRGLSVEDGAPLGAAVAQLDEANETTAALKELADSLISAKGSITSKFGNYKPLIGPGHYLVRVLRDRVLGDADKLDKLETVQASTAFVKKLYSDNLLIELQNSFSITEKDLFVRYSENGGKEDIDKVFSTLLNSMIALSEKENPATLVARVKDFDAKSNAVIKVHAAAATVIETKLKCAASVDVRKMITEKLTTEAKATILRIADGSDANADEGFKKSAKLLEELSSGIFEAEEAIEKLKGGSTDELANSLDGRLNNCKITLMPSLVKDIKLDELSPARLQCLAGLAAAAADAKHTLDQMLDGVHASRLGNYLLKRISSRATSARTDEDLRSAAEATKLDISRATDFLTAINNSAKTAVAEGERPDYDILSEKVALATGQDQRVPVALFRYAIAVSGRASSPAKSTFADAAKSSWEILHELRKDDLAQRFAIAMMDILAKKTAGTKESEAAALLRGGEGQMVLKEARTKMEEFAPKRMLRGRDVKLLNAFDVMLAGLSKEPVKANDMAKLVSEKLKGQKSYEAMLKALEPVASLYLSAHQASRTAAPATATTKARRTS